MSDNDQSEMTVWTFGDLRVRSVEIGPQCWFVLDDVLNAIGLPEDDPRRGDLFELYAEHHWLVVDRSELPEGCFEAGGERSRHVGLFFAWRDPEAFDLPEPVILVNLGGVYAARFCSTAPRAHEFEEWFTWEVLPVLLGTADLTQGDRVSAAA